MISEICNKLNRLRCSPRFRYVTGLLCYVWAIPMRIILQIPLPIGIWFALSLLFPYASHAAEVTQKIRIGVPSLALTYMPFYVAQEKGFLAKAGLEAEYIQMNTGRSEE